MQPLTVQLPQCYSSMLRMLTLLGPDGSTSNRNGAVIYNAERSETIKAALMAGASRFTFNTSTTANVEDYRVAAANQTDNGLDWRYGAGQLNINNSYNILAAG